MRVYFNFAKCGRQIVHTCPGTADVCQLLAESALAREGDGSGLNVDAVVESTDILQRKMYLYKHVELTGQ